MADALASIFPLDLDGTAIAYHVGMSTSVCTSQRKPFGHLSLVTVLMALVLGSGTSQASESTAHSNYAPVNSAPLFDKTDTLPIATKDFRVVNVTDLRKISKDNSRLIGAASIGPFQERSWLWSDEPVDQEVSKLMKLWFPDTSSNPAIPIRIELASFESWTIPTTNPAAARAMVRLRVISVNQNWRGVLVEASQVREGPNTPANQMALLRACLRKALGGILNQDWQRMPPLTGVGEVGQDPDVWTNPLKLSGNNHQSVSRTLIHGSQTIGQSGYGTGIRAVFYHEPETGRNPEFWAGVRIRDPDVSGYQTWVGEVHGGKGYQHRMGSTSVVSVSTFGMIFGIEKFQDEAGTKDYWKYIGMEVRSGGRWEPEGFSGLSGEVGAHAALRIPSTLQFFDFGFYVEAGHRF